MSQGDNQAKIPFGRLLCGVGIFIAVIGAFFVSVATNVIGIVLRMVGDALGARRFGTLTIIPAVLTLAVGIFIGQGVLPVAYDRITSSLTK